MPEKCCPCRSVGQYCSILSFARASAFNRPAVEKFYDNLFSVMEKYEFAAQDIYNAVETGCTTVQKPKQVIAAKGRKQVGSVTSQERGGLVAVTYSINAAGNNIPPMFIFPRVNYHENFIRGAPPGSIGVASRSGWINEELFLIYLQHVITKTRCSREHKILLILDNHESHVTLKEVDLTKENGIVMLTLPAHTTHKL